MLDKLKLYDIIEYGNGSCLSCLVSYCFRSRAYMVQGGKKMVLKLLAIIAILFIFFVAPLEAATVTVTSLAFWGASVKFPNSVHFDSVTAMIIVAALYFVVLCLVRIAIGLLVGAMITASALTLSAGGFVLSLLVFLVGFMFAGTMSVLLLDKCMASFAVSGVKAAFLLSLIPAICSAAVTAIYNTGHCRPAVLVDNGALYGDFYHPGYGGYHTPTTFSSDHYMDEFLYPSESFFDDDFWNL